MRVNPIELLKSFRDRYASGNVTVLDIGSMDLHGNKNNAKTVFSNAVVTGVDIAPGNNVDVVIPANPTTPVGSFDVVVSSNTFEHVKRPWQLFQWATTNLKPGGHIFIVSPFSFEYHRHPVDCWRFTPDSYQVLCDDNGITLLESEITRWCGTLIPMFRDAAWLIAKKGDTKAAFNVLRNFRHRIPHYDCHMIGRKQ
jgi:SAM-dependent methyltransferase